MSDNAFNIHTLEVVLWAEETFKIKFSAEDVAGIITLFDLMTAIADKMLETHQKTLKRDFLMQRIFGLLATEYALDKADLYTTLTVTDMLRLT